MDEFLYEESTAEERDTPYAWRRSRGRRGDIVRSPKPRYGGRALMAFERRMCALPNRCETRQ